MFRPLEKPTTEMTTEQTATQKDYIDAWLAECKYTHPKAMEELGVSASTFKRWLYGGWSMPKRTFYAMEYLRTTKLGVQNEKIDSILS